jgi:DNA-binding HxlR family transcriptional regulator
MGQRRTGGQRTAPAGADVTTAPAGADVTATACDAALARAFTFLGKRWSGVLLATLANGSVGFAELARRVEGISDSVLSDRLVELQQAGLVVRTVDPGPPVAVAYALSDSGAALMPAMHELSAWAAANLTDGA